MREKNIVLYDTDTLLLLFIGCIGSHYLLFTLLYNFWLLERLELPFDYQSVQLQTVEIIAHTVFNDLLTSSTPSLSLIYYLTNDLVGVVFFTLRDLVFISISALVKYFYWAPLGCFACTPTFISIVSWQQLPQQRRPGAPRCNPACWWTDGRSLAARLTDLIRDKLGIK